jgi:anaphase-promoting complex subunit 8
MKNFYFVDLSVTKIENQPKLEAQASDTLTGLLLYFNNNMWLLKKLAKLKYFIQEQDTSIDICNKMRNQDPYCVEFYEALSHIYYIKELQNELGELAISSIKNKKYSYESCMVLGNYWSSLSEH